MSGPWTQEKLAYVERYARALTNEKNVKMYHLLFFSQHAAGLTLWRNVTRIEPTGQRNLPF